MLEFLYAVQVKRKDLEIDLIICHKLFFLACILLFPFLVVPRLGPGGLAEVPWTDRKQSLLVLLRGRGPHAFSEKRC